MKKLVLSWLLVTTASVTQAQDILFIGLYNKPETGIDYWCRNMEIVKQVVNTKAEAEQLSKEFKIAHAQESPVVKIVNSGVIVLFEFQRSVPGFNCIKKVIGFRTGNTIKDAQKVLDADKPKILKEYKSMPSEIFSWDSKIRTRDEVLSVVSGVDIKLISYKNLGTITSSAAFFSNPSKDSTAMVQLIKDGVVQNSIYTVPAGNSFNLNVGRFKTLEMKMRMVPKSNEAEQPVINWFKQQINERWIEENKVIKSDRPVGGIRG